MGIEDGLHGLQGRYLAAPQWLRSLLGEGYALLPPRLRHGPNYARFAREAACRDPVMIERLADEKLAATLRIALLTVPAYTAYRALLDRGDGPRACLARLPLTSKQDIKRLPSAYRSMAAPASRGLRTFTGGSTAQPLEFLLERHVSRPRETAYVDALNREILGMARHDLTLSLHGRTVGSAAREGGRLWMYEPIKRHLMFSSDHLESRFMPDYARELRRWRPAQIHAYPSALLPLARWLADHPCPEFSEGVRGILLTSENMYAAQVEFLRAMFPRARIVKHYGHSERVLMATSVDGDTAYRFAPLYGHLELVDPAGRTITTPGVPGEIVGTSFDNHVMPFLRYRTGDLGTWGEAAPGTAPVLRSIDGRLQEFVVCRDRRLVSITTLGAAHFTELALADSIQYEQHEAGRLDLKVVARRELDAGAVASIERAVSEKTQGGVSVRVHRVARIERTSRRKHRMLIQHLDLADYLGAATAPAGASAEAPEQAQEEGAAQDEALDLR